MVRLMRLAGTGLGVAIAAVVLVRRWRALEREIDAL
jgi:hypothetical protein